MTVEPERSTCFVVMPFGEPFDSYYRQIISPAIVSNKLVVVRGDDINHPGPIMEQIWNEISVSRLCVAELTGHNPNVMYELGLAHALGKPVVQIAQNATDLPFDLRHLRSVVYNTNKACWDKLLTNNLSEMIRSVLSDPDSSNVFRNSNVNMFGFFKVDVPDTNIVMGTISHSLMASLPLDNSIKYLIRLITDIPGSRIPSFFPNGLPTEYSMYWPERRRELGSSETLRSAGVRPGETLRLDYLLRW